MNEIEACETVAAWLGGDYPEELGRALNGCTGASLKPTSADERNR